MRDEKEQPLKMGETPEEFIDWLKTDKLSGRSFHPLLEQNAKLEMRLLCNKNAFSTGVELSALSKSEPARWAQYEKLPIESTGEEILDSFASVLSHFFNVENSRKFAGRILTGINLPRKEGKECNA